MARVMNRSQILPEMIKELESMEETRDAFINMVLKSQESPGQIAEYKKCVGRCNKKIKAIERKIKQMDEFIVHQTHQSSQKGKK
jgi:hypothetical protein